MKKTWLALIAFLLCGTSLRAQEINVTADVVELKAKNTKATLILENTGTLNFRCFNDNTDYYNTLWTTVNRDLTKCYNVYHNGSKKNTFYVRGDGTTVSTQNVITSDERMKENIKDLTSSLDKITKLHPKTYNMKDAEKNNKRQIIGIISQELEKYYPEMILEDENGFKLVDYNQITIVLLKAVQEQQLIVEDQQKQIDVLADCCTKSKLKSGNQNKILLIDELGSEIKIYQNVPNPFSENTKIEYFLPENIKEATICIYNMNGTQLKSIELHQRNSGYVEINGGEFSAGMYMYALIADGKLVDTKTMVLTN